jgi:asparagine synthetase B (glutamine-hydrolysing)
MCGIFAAHGLENPAAERSKFIALSKKQRHRGPDWSGCYVGQSTVLVHERLAIVGVGELVFTSDVVSIGEYIFRFRRAATF